MEGTFIEIIYPEQGFYEGILDPATGKIELKKVEKYINVYKESVIYVDPMDVLLISLIKNKKKSLTRNSVHFT